MQIVYSGLHHHFKPQIHIEPSFLLNPEVMQSVMCLIRTQGFVVYYAACKRDFSLDSWSDVMINFIFKYSDCHANQATFGEAVVE